jgi:class 3 adenylate cyclase
MQRAVDLALPRPPLKRVRIRFADFKAEMPEILGYKRFIPQLDVRAGTATADVLVGNIGSEVTMNYTVMGDTEHPSRLGGANKITVRTS